jgi:hypothetical protein
MEKEKYDLTKIYSLIQLWKSFFEENESLISKSYLLKLKKEKNELKKLKKLEELESIQYDKIESIYDKIILTYNDIKTEKKANLFFSLLFKNEYVSKKLSDAENIFPTEGSFNPRAIGKFSDFTRTFLYAFNIKYSEYKRKEDPDHDKNFILALDMMKKYPKLTVEQIMEIINEMKKNKNLTLEETIKKLNLT